MSANEPRTSVRVKVEWAILSGDTDHFWLEMDEKPLHLNCFWYENGFN